MLSFISYHTKIASSSYDFRAHLIGTRHQHTFRNSPLLCVSNVAFLNLVPILFPFCPTSFPSCCLSFLLVDPQASCNEPLHINFIFSCRPHWNTLGWWPIGPSVEKFCSSQLTIYFMSGCFVELPISWLKKSEKNLFLLLWFKLMSAIFLTWILTTQLLWNIGLNLKPEILTGAFSQIGAS